MNFHYLIRLPGSQTHAFAALRSIPKARRPRRSALLWAPTIQKSQRSRLIRRRRRWATHASTTQRTQWILRSYCQCRGSSSVLKSTKTHIDWQLPFLISASCLQSPSCLLDRCLLVAEYPLNTQQPFATILPGRAAHAAFDNVLSPSPFLAYPHHEKHIRSSNCCYRGKSARRSSVDMEATSVHVTAYHPTSVTENANDDDNPRRFSSPPFMST